MDHAILNEVQRSLGRIEGKQDALLLNQDRLRDDYDTLRKDTDDLRSKLNWYSGGLAAAVPILVVLKDRILHNLFGI